MRIKVDIDDELVKEAFSLSEFKRKKELIHEALKLFVKAKRRKDLSELAGAVSFHEGYNYKELRRMRR